MAKPKEYNVAADVQELAKIVLQEDAASPHPKFSHIDLSKVFFLREACDKPKMYVAKIKGLRPPFNFITDYRYIVTVAQNPYDSKDKDTQKKVIEHEFMHIDTEFKGDIIKHDVEDFRAMIKQYGVDWVLGETDAK